MLPGDNVVCINGNDAVKKGQIYHILSMKKEYCGCITVNVGIGDGQSKGLPITASANCRIHGLVGPKSVTDGIRWLHMSRFSPIESLSEEQVDAILDNILQEETLPH